MHGMLKEGSVVNWAIKTKPRDTKLVNRVLVGSALFEMKVVEVLYMWFWIRY
jgi:hypothetical protein